MGRVDHWGLETHIWDLLDELEVEAFVWMGDPDAFGGELWGHTFIQPDGTAYIHLAEHPSEWMPYLIALHEVGHLIHQRYQRSTVGFRQFWRPYLLDEALAWRWAIDNTKHPLGQPEWRFICFCLNEALNHPRRKRVPEFTQLYDEIHLNYYTTEGAVA